MTARFATYFLGFIVLAFIGVIIWQLLAYKVAEPVYRVIEKDHNIEIRSYPSLLIAEVSVKGERYAAINAGFRELANFIFGNNSEQTPIAMTAPVLQQPAKAAPADLDDNSSKDWVIRFIMPVKFKIGDIPKPVNPRVKLVELPPKKYAAIVFSGFSTNRNIQNHLTMLELFCKNKALKTVGRPIFAFYNPPWILPFLRRNEVLIEIK